jgi:hypothetical protein
MSVSAKEISQHPQHCGNSSAAFSDTQIKIVFVEDHKKSVDCKSDGHSAMSVFLVIHSLLDIVVMKLSMIHHDVIYFNRDVGVPCLAQLASVVFLVCFGEHHLGICWYMWTQKSMGDLERTRVGE